MQQLRVIQPLGPGPAVHVHGFRAVVSPAAAQVKQSVLVGRYGQRGGGDFCQSAFNLRDVLHMHMSAEIADHAVLFKQSPQQTAVADDKAASEQAVVLKKILVADGHHFCPGFRRALQLLVDPVQRALVQKTRLILGVYVHHQYPELRRDFRNIAQAVLVPGKSLVEAQVCIDLFKFPHVHTVCAGIAVTDESGSLGAVQIVVAGDDQHRYAGILHTAELFRKHQMALTLTVEAQVSGKNEGVRAALNDLRDKGLGQLLDVFHCLAVRILDHYRVERTVVVKLRGKVVQIGGHSKLYPLVQREGSAGLRLFPQEEKAQGNNKNNSQQSQQ